MECSQSRSPIPECPPPAVRRCPGYLGGEQTWAGVPAEGGSRGHRKSVTDRAPLSPAGEAPEEAGSCCPLARRPGSTWRVHRLSHAGGKAAAGGERPPPLPRTPGSPGHVVASVMTVHNHQGAQSREGLVAGGLQDPWAAHTGDLQAVGFRWEPRFPFCIFWFYLLMQEPNKIPSRLFPSD